MLPWRRHLRRTVRDALTPRTHGNFGAVPRSSRPPERDVTFVCLTSGVMVDPRPCSASSGSPTSPGRRGGRLDSRRWPTPQPASAAAGRARRPRHAARRAAQADAAPARRGRARVFEEVGYASATATASRSARARTARPSTRTTGEGRRRPRADGRNARRRDRDCRTSRRARGSDLRRRPGVAGAGPLVLEANRALVDAHHQAIPVEPNVARRWSEGLEQMVESAPVSGAPVGRGARTCSYPARLEAGRTRAHVLVRRHRPRAGGPRSRPGRDGGRLARAASRA